MEQDRWLVEMAAAIADGRTVDWAAADARAQDQSDRDLIARLKSVEQVSRGHAAAGTDSSTFGATWPRTAADAVPLTSWGPFRLLERVGRGTFGDVYRAQDPHLDRPIALKLLRRPEPGVTDSAVIEEARLMARVRHPNVVTVFGADRIDGRAGVWMEFIDGQSLEQALNARGPFPPADVAEIGADLCQALTAVHAAGLLHRDMKAQNVMRDTRGRIVLTDFGAGREAPLSTDLTVELAGTPLYMAPEVLAGGQGSPQSEVYGLGVLLFHLATASFPVSGRSLRELLDAHDNAKDKTVSFPTAFPVALAAAIRRALAFDPTMRFQSATDMEDALRTSVTRSLPRLHVRRWKARWLILPMTLAGAALAWLVATTTPALYRAQARIQVVPPKVPGFAQSTNGENLEQRLQAIKMPILSRTRLERLIQEFNLYPEERRTGLMNEIVQHMRDDIEVTPDKGDSFTVAYVGRSPATVMKVTERLAGWIKDESVKEGNLRAEGTDSFIESQVDSIKRKLEAMQARAARGRGQSLDRTAQLELQALEARYLKLLADKEDASDRVNLESRQMGEQFNLIEPARLPERAVGATRQQMTGYGALIGLALGLALTATSNAMKARARRGRR